MSASPSSPGPHEREQALFLLASSKPRGERGAWLERECGGDEALRGRLEELLEAHERADTRFDKPAETLRATIAMSWPPAPGLVESVGQTIGRYKLLEKIGEGGCGIVYVAEQTEPVRRRVALKVIKLGMDTREVVARFEAERQALAIMDHPNIAKALDAGSTESGRPYFVMELVRGIRITDYCDENRLPTAERLELFAKVCHAVQHAHQKGIIHRDLKPSNILVTLHDGLPVPKVIDFGIAKAIEGRLTNGTVYTHLHEFIGTPAYMSPEQAEMSGLDVDTRSDIYSLGVLLYELLTSETPFDPQELIKEGVDAIRRTIREVEPPRPSTRLSTMQGEGLTVTARRRGTDGIRLLHTIRGDLDWIVMKCLEKDRTRRYETANGLAMDLKRHLEDKPIEARPPSAAYRLQKTIRRNKLAFLAAGTVTIALALGLVSSTWSFLRERKAHAAEAAARKIADDQRQRAETNAVIAAEQRQRAEMREAEERRLLYVADMNLAGRAWDQSNMGQLRDLLDQTKSYPDRGFEWSYWLKQTHGSVATLRGHTGNVIGAAFSPDGRQIVTASFDQTARIWDAATGRALLTLRGHTSNLNCVVFSPDGARIATGSSDRTIKLWDAASGRETLSIKNQGRECNGLVFSPDGQRLVSAELDGTVRIWNPTSGKLIQSFDVPGNQLWCLSFSSDGRKIASACWDGTVSINDATTGQQLLKINANNGVVPTLHFSPDGRRLVTAGGELAKVWDAVTGQEILTLRGHSGLVFAVQFSPDGRRIATGSWDRTAKIWDAATGKEELTLKGHTGAISGMAFSSDGRRLVTTGADFTGRIWDVAIDPLVDEKGGQSRPLKGHTDYVLRIAFSPDGTKCASTSMDQTAKVWLVANASELVTLKGHTNAVSAVDFSPDGQRVVTGSEDDTAKVWDAATGRELLTLRGHQGEIWGVAFSPDGRRILTGSHDQTAKLWDASAGDELTTFKGHTDHVGPVAFSPDGHRVATSSDDRTMRVWDAGSGRELLNVAAVPEGRAVQSLAFSPDGRLILGGSTDNLARIWDSVSGKLTLTLAGNGAPIECVNFSPDGRRAVTGSFDGAVRLWEMTEGRELLAVKAHTTFVHGVRFTADGSRILSGSSDSTISVLQSASPEQTDAWEQEDR